MDEMRALYVVEDTTLPDFEQLKNNGLNTIFWCDHYLQFDTNRTISNLESLITSINGLDIDVYLDINPWQTSTQSEQPDPRSEDYLTFMQGKIEILFDTIPYPTLKGLLFDDVYIRADNPYWADMNSHCTDPNSCQYLRDIVNTYTQGISDTLKSINSNLKLSSNISVNEIPGANMEQLSDIFDFMIIMTDPDCTWDLQLINEGINKCGNTPTIMEILSVDIGTWLDPEHYIPNSTLENQFKIILKKGLNGYCLYASPSINTNLSFPRTKKGLLTPMQFINYIE